MRGPGERDHDRPGRRSAWSCRPTTGPGHCGTALAAVLAQDYPGELRASSSTTAPSPTRGWPTAAGCGCSPTAGRRAGRCSQHRDPDAGCRSGRLLRRRRRMAAGQTPRAGRGAPRRPAAEFASCGIAVDYAGAGIRGWRRQAEVTHADLLRSRMVMVHSSTYLARREALIDGIGLVDETIPGSQNEDWDLALRGARRHPIVYVDAALVRVVWAPPRTMARRWETRIEGLRWMLDASSRARRPAGPGRPGFTRSYLSPMPAWEGGPKRGDGQDERCAAIGTNVGCRSRSRWPRGWCRAKP